MPCVALAVLIVVWEAGVWFFAIPEFLLPAPSRIYVDTMALGPRFWFHALATLQTTMIGFVVSIVVSLPLAVALTSSPAVAGVIYPLLVLTQAVPKVALAPILVVALGANELPRVVITFLVAFFPLVISISTGLLSVPADLVELVRSLRASRWQELWRLRLLYAVPFVFAGLKTAIALSVVGAVVGEFVAADRGLGFLITSSTAFFKTPLAFGAMILLAVMGIVLFQAICIAERIFFPWSSRMDGAARP